MNRRNFLKHTAAASATCFIGRAGRAAAPPQTGLSDDEIFAPAQTAIGQHRRGDGIVSVRSADGKPVAGATVKVEQVRHNFLFGCNFFMFGKLRNPQLEEEYRARFAALLNYATLGFYWAVYEPQRGKPHYDYTDRVIEWTRSRGITCKGHPLVWDHPAGNPRWLPDDLQDIGRLSHARVREIVSRFKGRMDVWDVVNEAVHLGQGNKEQPMSKWATKLGATKYVAEHLQIARAANPQATLLVNDYRLDPPYVKLLDSLRADGKLLFDVIGLQSHMHDGVWPLRTVWKHCETYAKLGAPLHFTETTVVSSPRRGPGENWGPTTPELEAKQADYVAKFYTTLFAHPAVQGLTWWDFSDNGAWQGAAAGLLRKDMSPKPVYDRLLALIKGKWWTRASGQTNDHGEFATRAFFGTHRITVEWPSGARSVKEVHWKRGLPNRFEISPS